MKIRLFFAWYDVWIGAYWSKKDSTLYVCPLPCIVISVCFKKGVIKPNTSLRALKDIESFCTGRMKIKKFKAAYRDVRYLVRQHMNSIQMNN